MSDEPSPTDPSPPAPIEPTVAVSVEGAPTAQSTRRRRKRGSATAATTPGKPVALAAVGDVTLDASSSVPAPAPAAPPGEEPTPAAPEAPPDVPPAPTPSSDGPPSELPPPVPEDPEREVFVNWAHVWAQRSAIVASEITEALLVKFGLGLLPKEIEQIVRELTIELIRHQLDLQIEVIRSHQVDKGMNMVKSSVDGYLMPLLKDMGVKGIPNPKTRLEVLKFYPEDFLKRTNALRDEQPPAPPNPVQGTPPLIPDGTAITLGFLPHAFVSGGGTNPGACAICHMPLAHVWHNFTGTTGTMGEGMFTVTGDGTVTLSAP